MKKTLGLIRAAVAAVVAVAVYAAQDTTLDGMAEVRDPVRLKVWLEGNASDAQTRIAAVEAAGVGGTLAPAYIMVGNASTVATAVAVSGDVTITTNGAVAIGANKVVESMLKAVDTAADEDFLTYESTTGDFEWHSIANVAGGIAAAVTEGQLADSTVVSADIKDGVIVNADVATNAAIALSKLANNITIITLTNVVYNGATGDVRVVTWAP
jgi:hypothetical protein